MAQNSPLASRQALFALLPHVQLSHPVVLPQEPPSGPPAFPAQVVWVEGLEEAQPANLNGPRGRYHLTDICLLMILFYTES